MNINAINTATKGKTKTSGTSPFSEIELDKIYPNPDQPRKEFNNIEELAEDIVKHGLMQPVVVVKTPKGYMLIAGERRWRAHQHAKKKTIRAHVLEVNDQKVQELSLIENIQREDLTDFETAQAIIKLWESGNYAKKQDLAKAISKPPSYVSKVFSISNLDDEIKTDIAKSKDKVGLEVMQELSKVKDKTEQKKLYKTKAKREEIRKAQKRKIAPAKEKYKKVFFANVPLQMKDAIDKIYSISTGADYKITIEEI